MEIQNLSPNNPPNIKVSKPKINIYMVMVAFFGIFTAFWLSRFFPSTKSPDQLLTPLSSDMLSADNISEESIEVGKSYGNSNGNFSDTATGVIISGSINGVGTHILEREGGVSQRASLTSSTLDLDLFIDRKVQIKGETNTSDKTSWLLDVGAVTVLE